MRWLLIVFISTIVSLVIFSYGFVDGNLVLSRQPWYAQVVKPLQKLAYVDRGQSTIIFLTLVLSLFFCYGVFLYATLRRYVSLQIIKRILIGTTLFLVLSYPAFSYDMFNYILTAKVTFSYKENPYLIMPVEIENEPMLAYTRASNKVALYGPTWILLTYLPNAFGKGNIWLTIVLFKLTVAGFYLIMLWLIYKITKSWWNVVFFGLNPLILVETLLSGHNDIVMIVMATAGILLVRKRGVIGKGIGILLYIASIFVKGATVVLAPLFLVQSRLTLEKSLLVAYWLMFAVFLLTPMREELYPWYATWFLAFAALVAQKKARFIQGFSVAMSLGLLLRYLPYIYTREYGGSGPTWRLVFTILPPLAYVAWYLLSQKLSIGARFQRHDQMH